MDRELQELLDKAGLSPEDRAKAEAAFSIDGLSKAVKEGTMRQSDYDRKQNELKARRKELEDKWNAAATEHAELYDAYQELVKDSEATKAEKEEAAKKLADAQKALDDAKKNAIDPDKVLTVDKYAEEQKKMAAGQTAYWAQTLQVLKKHEKLFGADLDPQELIDGALQAKKSPLEYWRGKYNVEAKEAEIAKAAHDKEMSDAETRGYQKRISEEANPATRTLQPSQNPFFTADVPEGNQPWDEDGTPASEKALLEQLQAARG